MSVDSVDLNRWPNREQIFCIISQRVDNKKVALTFIFCFYKVLTNFSIIIFLFFLVSKLNTVTIGYPGLLRNPMIWPFNQATKWNVMQQILTLSFGFCFYFPVIFQFSYLLPFTIVFANLLARDCRPRDCNKGDKKIEVCVGDSSHSLFCKWSMFFDMILIISSLGKWEMGLSKIVWLTWLEGESR